MESWYDQEEDIYGVRLTRGKYFKSVELPNGIVLDITKQGAILGIEIMKASKTLVHAKEILEAAELR